MTDSLLFSSTRRRVSKEMKFQRLYNKYNVALKNAYSIHAVNNVNVIV